MEALFAPWRYKYIASVDKKRDEGCIFCKAPEKSDDDALILFRGKYSYVIMNLFPYNTGHVMVVPYRHIGDYEELSREEALEMHMLVQLSIRALRRTYRPHGFNIGINLGRVAGAGIEDHLHIHIVPRWNGDTNFMPVIAGVKVVSQDVRESYRMLKPAFREEAEKMRLLGRQ